MTIEEIKLAVRNNQVVHWKSHRYVVKLTNEQFDIVDIYNDSCVGLTNREMTELNGKENDFYIG